MPESEFESGIFSLAARTLITRKANFSRTHFYNFIEREDGMKDKIITSHWPEDHLIRKKKGVGWLLKIVY